MICYRDMTFCTYYKDCMEAGHCDRPLTPEIRIEADAWWGQAGAPIAVYAEKPDCWSEWSRI